MIGLGRVGAEAVGDPSIGGVHDDAGARRAEIGLAIQRRIGEIASGAKHERLKKAIIHAIVLGELRAGDQLPTETALAALTGVSLGAVRRCLAKLAADTVITREHGRGTFVSSHTQSVNDLWHLRFLAEDGRSLLPVYTRVLRRSMIVRHGPWSHALGPSEAGYVRVERSADVDGRFVCYSDFYLSADRFQSILDASAIQLELSGLRTFIAERFNIPTVRARKLVTLSRVSGRAASVISAAKGDAALRLEVIGYTYNDAPLSYQCIYVPANAAAMDVSAQPERANFRRGQML